MLLNCIQTFFLVVPWGKVEVYIIKQSSVICKPYTRYKFWSLGNNKRNMSLESSREGKDGKSSPSGRESLLIMSFILAMVISYDWLTSSWACKIASTKVSKIYCHSAIPLSICWMFTFIIITESTWMCIRLISSTTILFKRCKFSVKILSLLLTFLISNINQHNN